ncbi:uncharacterized protein LOC127790875 [Diospyros lotus]|uniref:uncharacterized protein LOC127790875 n=1 Tax=Diospyros lotus TaxID=55363 RepID=UPI002256560F|nr:uncharacterized protein LOC127790875 [Diospyros lotus]
MVLTKGQYNQYWLCCILRTLVQPWPPCLLLNIPHLLSMSLTPKSLDLSSWTTIGMGEVRDGLYHLLRLGVSPSALVDVLPAFPYKDQLLSASVTHKDSTSDLWHCRLGHISFSRLLLIDDPLAKQNLSSSNTHLLVVFALWPSNIDSIFKFPLINLLVLLILFTMTSGVQTP